MVFIMLDPFLVVIPILCQELMFNILTKLLEKNNIYI